ncbi:MAG: HPr kinase/phosphorylase [Clostridia bacterium]|nr:HPr(Ser) kinase/phosphatase [Eubacteriales bacterium]MDD3866017.1 HPr(Ser) kinase/phosphatase [Eubacteriales bacterium]MDD4461224.1 HPr(Ser) kinase/phosphatase [Eubacteriales bacterium]NCC48188.1 HPr kinase/phosphorylase [Clostridia bacterium]
MAPVSLDAIIKEFELEKITDFANSQDIQISVADVTRPGLQLAGYFDHFGPDRIQVLGNMETAFLDRLSPEDRYQRLDALFEKGIPCLVLTRNHDASKELIECSQRYRIPILRTEDTTATFISSIVKYLNVELAPKTSLHGVLIEVYGEGILILGESGVGKSETALEVVKRGHRLIADDLVEIRRVSDKTLLGRAPEIIRHLIEIRGVGILDVKELYGVSSVKMQENVNFVINLELWDENKTYERLGVQEETTEILGINVPSITIPVRPGRNLAIIVEVAAINFRQKQMGYNAAKALTDRVFGSAIQS